MTHRGPFQPLPFCDSVILLQENPGTAVCRVWDRARHSPGERGGSRS